MDEILALNFYAIVYYDILGIFTYQIYLIYRVIALIQDKNIHFNIFI